MIVAVEGIDGVGKTTLWTELRKHVPGAVFVPKLSDPGVGLIDATWSALGLWNAELWSALHCRGKLYISDRHIAVSGPVYDAVFGRRRQVYCPDLPIAVVYIYGPPYRTDPLVTEAKLDALRAAYADVLSTFDVLRLRSTDTVEHNAEAVKLWVKSL